MSILDTIKTDFMLVLKSMEDDGVIGTKKIVGNNNSSPNNYALLFSPILSKEKKLKIVNSWFNKYGFVITEIMIDTISSDLIFKAEDIKGRIIGTLNLTKGEWNG